MKHYLDLIGRIFLSFPFFYEVYDSVAYVAQTKAKMDEYGLHDHQNLLLYGSIFVLTLGGLMLLTGYRARFGAILLILYWVPVTFIVHDFWTFEEPQRRLEGIYFMRNIAITGGLLMVFANGVGKYAIRRLFATSRVRGT